MDRIIRTCSLALAAALSLAPAARANVEDRAELSAYARARAADSFGAAGDAAESYAAALRLAPDNELLAARALAQALADGNRPLALQAAAVLQRAGQLAPDARLLLLVEALCGGNPRQAKIHADALAGLEPFAFMAPILNAWIAFDAKRSSALPVLAGAEGDGLAAAYAAEHRPLLLLATGKTREGVDELLKVTAAGGARAQRLRIAGAAYLARKSKDEQALRLLVGDEPPIAAARAAVRADKPLRGEIASGRAGVGEFLVRLALDLDRQDVDALALAYAQLATFAAPENSETWLVASDLLARRGEEARALALLANVPADDPFAGGLADRRIRLLTATGDKARSVAAFASARARRCGRGGLGPARRAAGRRRKAR